MKRRAYLSVTGLFLLAGCSSQDTTETTTSTTEAPSPTGTPAPTTTTETPTATPTETETEEPTTTETTTEELDRVDRILNLAAADLTDAVTVFEDAAGPDGGFHDVDATTNLNFDDVANPLYLARGHLNTLEQLDKTEAQQRRLTKLWGVYWFLWWTARTYENLRLALVRVNNAVSRFYAGEYYRIDTQAEQVRESLEPARGTLENLRDESNASDLDAFDALTPDDYTRKVDALETEITQFDQFTDYLLTMRNAINRLQRGFDDYLDENYADASGSFFRASLAFEDVHEALTETDPVEGVATHVEEFRCLSDALAMGSDGMDEAATAGDNDIPEKQPELEDEAKAAFETCELTAERIPIIPEFFDQLPEQRT